MICRQLFLLPFVLLAGLSHAELTTSEAFSLGQGDGTAGTGTASGAITGGNAQTNLPYYGTSAPESSLFAGGQGGLFGPSATKIDGCKTGYTGTDQPGKQECDAINFLFKNVQERPQITVSKADPALVASHMTIKSASTQVGTLPGMEGNYSACVTRTETIPGDFTTETCADYQSASQNVCSMGQEVTVEGNFNYQCDKTQQAVQQSSCNKNLGVTVTQQTQYCGSPGATEVQTAVYGCQSTGYALITCGANPGTHNVTLSANMNRCGWCSVTKVITEGVQSKIGPCHACANTVYDMYLDIKITCAGSLCTAVTRFYLGGFTFPCGTPTLNFTKPSSLTLTYSKSWDNQCTTLEARAQ